MKLFLVRCTKFGFIFSLILYGLELFYSSVESDYVYKADRLYKNTIEFENLILGSSHAYYGINPEHFSQPTFNLSHVSQSLDLDMFLLEKFKEKTNVKNVIIPISYHSFNGSLSESTESWRLTDYHHAYGFKDIKIMDKFFLNTQRNGFIDVLMKAVFSPKDSRRFVDMNGFVSAPCDPTKISIHDAEIAIERHRMSERLLNKEFLSNNQLRILEEHIRKNQNLNFVLVSLPVHTLYAERRDPDQLVYVEKCINYLTSSFVNVRHYDYGTLVLPDSCFLDTDHLSAEGARTLSRAIDKELEN